MWHHGADTVMLSMRSQPISVLATAEKLEKTVQSSGGGGNDGDGNRKAVHMGEHGNWQQQS